MINEYKSCSCSNAMFINFQKKVYNFKLFSILITSLYNLMIILLILEWFSILHLICPPSYMNSKMRKSNFKLFRIRGIRKSLTFILRKTLVTSLVVSVIGYCSILLSGLPAFKILRSTVRVIYNIPHVKIIMTYDYSGTISH